VARVARVARVAIQPAAVAGSSAAVVRR